MDQGGMTSCQYMPGMQRGHTTMSMSACHQLQCRRHAGPAARIITVHVGALVPQSVVFQTFGVSLQARPATGSPVRPRGPPLYIRYTRLLI